MVRRALFWSYASQFAIFAASFGGSVIVARLLSPHELGVYGVAMATIGLLQVFAAFNVGAYVVREVNLTKEVIDSAFTVNAALSLVLAAATFALGSVGARFLSEPAVAGVIRAVAVLPVIGIFSFRPNMMLQRAMLFRGTSILGVAGAITTSVVTALAAWFGQSYMSPAYGSIVGAVLTAVGICVIGRNYVATGISLADWRGIAGFGLRLMSIGGVATAAQRLSEISIARILSVTALGLFNRSANLSNLMTQNIYGSATRVVFVKLSEAQREGASVTDVFTRSFRMIAAVMGPMFGGVAVLAAPLIYVLYGEKWIAAAPLLTLIMIGQLISLSFAMNWELFVVRDRLKEQSRLEISRSILFVILVASASTIGLVAVAWASVVQATVSAAIYARLMPGLAGAPWRFFARMFGEALGLTGIAILPAAVLMTAWRGDAHTPLPLILAAVLAGVALWWLALRALGHPLEGEIQLVGRKLRHLVSPPRAAAGEEMS